MGEQKSVERQYRIEGSYAVVFAHRQAERRLIADLDHVLELDSSPASRATVARLLRLQADYHSASQALFNAVDENDQERVLWFDHSAVDPVFGVLADVIYRQAAAASASALGSQRRVARRRGARQPDDRDRGSASRCCWSPSSARSSCATAAASTRPSPPRSSAWPRWRSPIRSRACATIAPSTRTSRASCSASGRTGVPLALVLLDLDDLKAVNDAHGHQAGDERLQALADAIRATGRGADLAYRVGGDEFAVILPDARALGRARVRPAPARRDRRPATTAPSPSPRPPASPRRSRCAPRTSSIREADLALIGAKRIHQDVVIYGPDLAPGADGDAQEDEHHSRTLASALARAVDAKDSYTRSHCQTVSQLCGLIGAELGLDAGGSRACAWPGCCTTSARSACPTRSSTSPPSSPTTSTST